MKLPFRLRKIFRVRRRWLLTLVNENSLAPILQLSMHRSMLITIVVLLVLLSGVGWYMMFRYTPMRNLLPLRIDTSLREDYARLAARVDSMAVMAAVNGRFAGTLESILVDSVPAIEADTAGVNLYDLPLDSLMEAGKAEERFVSRFENSERFNLSVLSPIAAEGMVFYPPVTGMPLTANNAEGDLTALSLTAGPNTPVSAVYRGTVIDAYYTTTKGITVLIQHPNNFMSQYSGLGDVFVARGAKVSAGQRIGIAAGQRYPLTFMLWHDGTALDPAEYIQMPRTDVVKADVQPFVPTKKRR